MVLKLLVKQHEAKKIYDQCYCVMLEIWIEIEIVPFKVAEFISNNIDVFMGMGSGVGCDAQYLFAEDI